MILSRPLFVGMGELLIGVSANNLSGSTVFTLYAVAPCNNAIRNALAYAPR